MKYAAFISYNHRDRPHAAWLHRALETYRIPKRLRGRETYLGTLGSRLPPIFQDREELAASSNLAASVSQALEQSASLIVICSPNSVKSHWVNEEIRAFTALGRRDHIQCLIVGGEPNARDPDQEALPPALFENGGEEPLASDIRAGQDGKKLARLKLLAGVLGVGFDELRQREQARRQRRLVLVAAASAVGFVITSALAVFALVARAEAVQQRDIARQKTATAERTVDFVQSLFEVSDPSEAKGSQVTAQEILDRGAQRIDATLENEPNVKAELMTTLSRVYLGLGSFRRGDAIVRRSLRLDVSDPDVRGRQLLALADSQTRQGDYGPAVATLNRALNLARKGGDGSQALIGAMLAARGEARSQQDDHIGAQRDINEALRLDTANLGSRHPAVARDLEALGFDLIATDRLAEARALFERALAIRIPLQGLAHPKVSDDLNELGSIAYLQRDSAGAERYWRRGLASDERVLGSNHPDLAITLSNLARVILERRAYGEARPLLQRALAITLAQRSATHDTLAFAFANLAIAESGLGRHREAEMLLRRAWTVAELHKHRNRAPILSDLADLLCARGLEDQALQLIAKAKPLMQTDYPDDPWRSAWVENTQGACLVRKGEVVEGQRLLRVSLPAIRKRWPVGTLYRVTAEGRLARAPKSARPFPLG